MRPLVLITSLCVAQIAGWIGGFAPAFAQTTPHRPGYNLLLNPGHEHPGVYFEGRGEINVTWSWIPFWEEPPAGVDRRDPYYRTPEFRPVFKHEYPYRVHSGSGSDRWFNFFALNKKAGIMQYVVNVPIGKPLRFTTWVQLWSTHLSEQSAIPPRSIQDGNLRVRVCIDQDGGPRDMTDPNLVCSDWQQPYDRWEQIFVDGVAKNTAINVLIWSSAEIPVEHNDIYADDSCLEVLPAPGAKGICLGRGFVETGPGVVAPLADVINIRPPAQLPSEVPPPPELPAVKAPGGNKPALAVNAKRVLNLRAEPRADAKVVAKAQRGEILSVTAKSADGKWFRVTRKGTEGWVASSLTLPNAAARAVPALPVPNPKERAESEEQQRSSR